VRGKQSAPPRRAVWAGPEGGEQVAHRWGEPLKINDEALRQLNMVRVRRRWRWDRCKPLLAVLFLVASLAEVALKMAEVYGQPTLTARYCAEECAPEFQRVLDELMDLEQKIEALKLWAARIVPVAAMIRRRKEKAAV